jgi:hypothetical protein
MGVLLGHFFFLMKNVLCMFSKKSDRIDKKEREI